MICVLLTAGRIKIY